MEATWKLAHFLASEILGISRDDEEEEEEEEEEDEEDESESESSSGKDFVTIDLTNVWTCAAAILTDSLSPLTMISNDCFFLSSDGSCDADPAESFAVPLFLPLPPRALGRRVPGEGAPGAAEDEEDKSADGMRSDDEDVDGEGRPLRGDGSGADGKEGA